MTWSPEPEAHSAKSLAEDSNLDLHQNVTDFSLNIPPDFMI